MSRLISYLSLIWLSNIKYLILWMSAWHPFVIKATKIKKKKDTASYVIARAFLVKIPLFKIRFFFQVISANKQIESIFYLKMGFYMAILKRAPICLRDVTIETTAAQTDNFANDLFLNTFCYMASINDLFWLVETTFHRLWQILMYINDELKLAQDR